VLLIDDIADENGFKFIGLNPPVFLIKLPDFADGFWKLLLSESKSSLSDESVEATTGAYPSTNGSAFPF